MIRGADYASFYRENQKRRNPVDLLQAILNMAYLITAFFALLGAIDFMKNSVDIFKEALRKRRERNDQ